MTMPRQWTQGDDDYLRSLYATRRTEPRLAHEAAEHLGRTVSAVKSRVVVLGINPRNGAPVPPPPMDDDEPGTDDLGPSDRKALKAARLFVKWCNYHRISLASGLRRLHGIYGDNAKIPNVGDAYNPLEMS